MDPGCTPDVPRKHISKWRATKVSRQLVNNIWYASGSRKAHARNLMVVKCSGRTARALRIRCSEFRSFNHNVPRKLGVTSGASGMVSGVPWWGMRYEIIKSWTFGRRERRSKRITGSSSQNRRFNKRNDWPK